MAGAFGATVNGNNDQGAAYVFVKPAGGWTSATETAKLTASDGVLDEMFGETVALSGDTVVAHSDAKVNGHALAGAVYLFVKPAGGWASATETAKLTASDAANDDDFGDGVAVSGDTVVAGAPDAKVNGHSQEGAAYVFVKPAGGWTSATETAKLTASDGATSDFLGGSVAVDGNTVVAGAPFASHGAAYVFVKPASGWASETETAKLTASDATDDLGFSVGVSGDAVVAGAFNKVNGNDAQGAAYVFVKPSGGWTSETEAAKLTASDGAAFDQLGFSVAISGNTVVAGAPFATVNGNSKQGAAYVFAQPDSTTTSVACSPSTIVAGHSTTCTATVTDTASGAQTPPTGTVSFSSAPGPGSFTGSPCTLSGSGASASCSVTYTPGGTAGTPVRTDAITATSSGDSTHAGSNGSTTVKVLSITLLDHGSFVIGDQNATVGTTVTFGERNGRA